MFEIVLSKTVIITTTVTLKNIAVPHGLVSPFCCGSGGRVNPYSVPDKSNMKLGCCEDGLVSFDWHRYQSATLPEQPELLHGFIGKVSVLSTENKAIGYH